MVRAAGMQVLTNQIRAERPGATIWGIGDEAHQAETSGHNEDDTPGVKAEDQDADSTAEHRALDIMIDEHFSAADAEAIYQDLTTIPENQWRLLYVIYNRRIRSASSNWVERPYTGKNPHTDHDHISGEADADANTTPWALPTFTGENVETEWSKANPLGVDPDGAARSPLQHERDVFAAVVQGKAPVDGHGVPVGPEAWMVTAIKELQEAVSTIGAPVIDYALLASEIVKRMPVPASPAQIADAVVDEIAS